jgi:mono/diheme cytochrome c family protein
MKRVASFLSVLLLPWVGFAKLTPEQLKQLPPPATHQINFKNEIKPIFEASCVRCHGRGRTKGGFQLDTRETLLKGGDSGAAIIPGKSVDSYLIALIAGVDPDSVMPKKGTKLTSDQVGVVRAWIDQGAMWDSAITFGKIPAKNLNPRLPEIPAGKASNPIDRFLAPYYAAHKVKPAKPVGDRVFARRVYLDVIGLLPSPKELDSFVADKHADKRERLVGQLLQRNQAYAQHWLTFWNDLLRNDYKGAGYIDGGRKQITKWLYSSLTTNKPFDQFVAELIHPNVDSEGFTKGIVWRGVVNASQIPPMQAAQNVSQVFMGINLKCASCHDSFVNDWQLADSYGLANLFSDETLEIALCDKPTGKKAETKFLFPELGSIPATTNKQERLDALAKVVTSKKDGRLTRTVVNRLWEKFIGRGLIEPVDDMDQTAWNQDLLDWLAEDLVAHNYDVKHTIKQILTSQAYQLPALNYGETAKDYVFSGPSVRRMSAEQFRDALTSLTGIGYSAPAADVVPSETVKKKFAMSIPVKWIWDRTNAAKAAPAQYVYFRKEITLPQVQDVDATALVVCDNSFTLYVNGQKVGAGNQFNEAYRFGLKRYLRAGENTFAIEAANHRPDNSLPKRGEIDTASANPAGLLFYARIRTARNGKEQSHDFASDKSWSQTGPQVQDGWQRADFAASGWKEAAELGPSTIEPWRVSKDYLTTKLAKAYNGKIRASLVAADPLMVALNRPNREQVVTVRSSVATTLQALELTNGETLSQILKRGAAEMNDHAKTSRVLIDDIYQRALGRKPARPELKLAGEVVGKKPTNEGVEDLLWAMVMLPEFQLIY